MNRMAGLGILIVAMIAAGRLARAQEAPVQLPEQAERRIFIPVEDLDVVLQHDRAGVMLPRAEFLKLSESARKQLELAPPASHKVVVSNADYAARIDGDQLAIRATIELSQLARGWQTLTLPFRGISVESATLDDKPAPLGRAAGEGRPLVVFLQKPGRHILRLDFSAPLAALGSDRVAAFGLAPISSATLRLTLPAEKHLAIDDVLIERPTAADRPADYSVPMGGKEAVSLAITDRKTRDESASLVFASTALGVNVAPEERTWRAVTALSIFGKPIDNLTFIVPKSLDVVSIESTGLE